MLKDVLSENSGWFEISDDFWVDPGVKPKKLKLFADAQFPKPVIEELRSAKVSVRSSVEKGLKSRSDSDILQHANKAGYVLLTLDRDFWDDKKYPLQKVRGIIFIDEPPDKQDQILTAFGLVYGCFAKSFSLDWWTGMKIRATSDEFVIKMRTWEGKVTKYAIQLRSGRLFAKELNN